MISVGEQEVITANEKCARCKGTGADPEDGDPREGPDRCRDCAERWREWRISMTREEF